MDCDTMITVGEHYITPNDAEKIEELLSKITDKKIREKLSMVISNCKVQKREWEIMHTVNGNADIDSVEAASASFSLDGTNYPPYGKGIRGR